MSSRRTATRAPPRAGRTQTRVAVADVRDHARRSARRLLQRAARQAASSRVASSRKRNTTATQAKWSKPANALRSGAAVARRARAAPGCGVDAADARDAAWRLARRPPATASRGAARRGERRARSRRRRPARSPAAPASGRSAGCRPARARRAAAQAASASSVAPTPRAPQHVAQVAQQAVAHVDRGGGDAAQRLPERHARRAAAPCRSARRLEHRLRQRQRAAEDLQRQPRIAQRAADPQVVAGAARRERSRAWPARHFAEHGDADAQRPARGVAADQFAAVRVGQREQARARSRRARPRRPAAAPAPA